MVIREVKDANKMDKIQRDPYRRRATQGYGMAALAILAIAGYCLFTAVPMLYTLAADRHYATAMSEDCGMSLYACVTKRCREEADKKAKYNTDNLGCIDPENESRYREECRTKLMQEYDTSICLTPLEAEYEREKE